MNVLTEITFVLGVGITNPPQIKDPTEKWHARFYDPIAEQFFAGNGATAWEAVQWALDERAHRLAGIVRMAVDPAARPTLQPLARSQTKHEPVVLTKEHARLPIAGVCTPDTKRKTAAARRSKKGGRRG